MIGESIKVKEQIKKLVELQKIDVDYYDIKRQLRDKPPIIEELKTRFEQKKSSYKALEEKLKTLQVDQKSKELELKSKEDAIVKADGQLAQLKSNKDYSAKLLEIENIKADKSIVEEKILLSYDAIDEVRSQLEKEKQIVAREEQAFNQQKKEIEDQIKVLEDRLKILDGQRKQLTPGVHAEFLQRYERIVKNKEGLAIVPVVHNTCGGCFMNVPDQVVNQIKMNEELVFCEMCARMLYLEDNL